ncbi:Flp pilus assembly protein TadD [Elusimicrobium posterum]|uniref:tetratricopeptide repeat protein n=1 Tax=Elusimicrobium posterum TaxID=3116653 RepID=UPI003C72080E
MKKYFWAVLLISVSLSCFAQDDKEKQAAEAAALESKVYLNYLSGVVNDMDEQFDNALKFYNDALSYAPESEFLKIQILHAALNAGKQKDYAQIAKDVSAYDDPQALAAYARYSWAEGNLHEAMEYYKKAIDAVPDNASLKLEYITLLKSVDVNLAIMFLEEMGQKDKEISGPIYHEIGLMQLENNQVPAAMVSFNRATKVSPELPYPYLLRAEVYKQNLKFSDAMSEYKNLQKLGFENPDLFNNMGTISVLLKDIPTAKEYFKKSLVIDPGNVMASKFLYTIAEDEQDFDSAELYLKGSADFNKDPAKIIQAAYYASRKGEKEESLRLMRQAYNLAPENNEVAYFYALSLQDMEMHKEADGVFKKIIAASPDNERARLVYTKTLFALENYAEAENQMRAILQTNPEDPDALNSLGYAMLLRNKKIDEAGEHIKKALAIVPDSPAFIDSMGWYYYKKKEYVKALDLLKDAYGKAQGDTEIAAHLGMTYYQLKDWENAVKYLQISEDKTLNKYLKKAQKNAQKEGK